MYIYTFKHNKFLFITWISMNNLISFTCSKIYASGKRDIFFVRVDKITYLVI